MTENLLGLKAHLHRSLNIVTVESLQDPYPSKYEELEVAESTGSIADFKFPLRTAKEIERFEDRVSKCSEMWTEYIMFLRKKKPPNRMLSTVLPELFTEDALDGYSPKGFRDLKKAMVNYHIFNHCMIRK